MPEGWLIQNIYRNDFFKKLAVQIPNIVIERLTFRLGHRPWGRVVPSWASSSIFIMFWKFALLENKDTNEMGGFGQWWSYCTFSRDCETLQKHEKAEYCLLVAIFSDANIAVVAVWGFFRIVWKKKSPHSRRNISVSLPTGFVKNSKHCITVACQGLVTLINCQFLKPIEILNQLPSGFTRIRICQLEMRKTARLSNHLTALFKKVCLVMIRRGTKRKMALSRDVPLPPQVKRLTLHLDKLMLIRKAPR